MQNIRNQEFKMPRFYIKWKITETGGAFDAAPASNTGATACLVPAADEGFVKDKVVAKGETTKEAASAEEIRQQLEPIMRQAYPELTGFTTREYHIDIKQVD
jgi:hypothetical protein